MQDELKDHIGYAAAAMDLLLHHMERLQAIATNSDDQSVISPCDQPLAQLRAAISCLHYKYFED
jgi:hypothetical protein